MQLYQLKFPNGKKYIGITTTTARRRFTQHCRPCAKNLVSYAIKVYGKENVTLTVLANVDNWELLCLSEEEAIEKYNTISPKGYNLTTGGEGVSKKTQETIEKNNELLKKINVIRENSALEIKKNNIRKELLRDFKRIKKKIDR